MFDRIVRVMNLSKRWVGVAMVAGLLGVSTTHVGNLVRSGHLKRHGPRGTYKYDIVQVIRLKAWRIRVGRPHGGHPTQLETLLRLKAETTQSITVAGARTKRMNRRARRGL